MFATIEEAERAARLLTKVTGRQAKVWPHARVGIAVGFVDESHFARCFDSWDAVADAIVAQRASVEDDHREALLALAKAHLGVARRLLREPEKLHTDPTYSTFAALVATFECLLEVV